MPYYCRVEEHTRSCYSSKEALTFVITFPRIVLAEVVTHRVNADGMWDVDISVSERTTTPDISKNSASSRAIPFEKMVKKVREDPFMPFWTLNQKGMQGNGMTDAEAVKVANREWLDARDDMVNRAFHLNAMGVHKQDVNRLLEPWMWVTQVVTSSRWDNFFALRCHKDAHPAFQRIARMMYLAKRKSEARPLEPGEWHLPFVSAEEKKNFRWVPEWIKVHYPLPEDPAFDVPLPIKKSAARCAWSSYENHDKDGSDEAHLKTWDRLLSGIPVHSSPSEHQLTPLHPAWTTQRCLISNITGFLQARKLIRQEEIVEYNPSDEEVASWGIE